MKLGVAGKCWRFFASQVNMVRMIPPYPRAGANKSEKAIFTALEGILDRPDWVVIHSLSIHKTFLRLGLLRKFGSWPHKHDQHSATAGSRLGP